VTPLCALQLQAQVTGQVASATASPSLNITGPGYEVAFGYYNQWEAGTDTSSFTLHFNAGEWIQANLTQGSGHNKVRLTTNSSATAAFGSYAQQSWYRLVIKVDLVNDQVHAEIRDLTGNLLATSSLLGVSSNATQVATVTFDNYYYGTDPLVSQPPHPFYFDDFQVKLPDPPTAPTLNAVPGPGVGQIALNWSQPSDDGGVPVLYYLLYRGNATGNETTLVANTTNFTFMDSGLGNGVKAYYVVKAANAVGTSPASNEASATTFTYPTAPQTLKAAPGANVGEIALTWNAPASNGGTPVTNYTIYRANTSGAETLLAQVGSNRSYADAHRPNGTTWFYTVTATNLVGEGPVSAEMNSTPKPDQAWAPTSITVSPTTGWAGDPRTVNFTYQVAVSQCDPNQACPVDHQWLVTQDGPPGGVGGAMLANGTNTHPGHAEIVTYNVSTTVTPTGMDGTHLLQVAANPRVGSTRWNESGIVFHLDAPVPGRLTGPATPQLNTTTTKGGTPIQVLSNYSVFQKQCRPADSCNVQNDWMILLDGNSSSSPDGLLLAMGNNTHPAHGETTTYVVNRSVFIPYIQPGPHYVKVAARADAASAWQVSSTLLSGVIFQPNLDDTTYDATASESAYTVTNTGHGNLWTLGEPSDLPTAGHVGSTVWGTNLVGDYPPLADGTLHLANINLTGTAHATLSLDTFFQTSDTYDAGQIFVLSNGQRALLEPTTGPAYQTLLDGARGYAGASEGWQPATFDLSSYAGQVVELQFEFRSDALTQGRGWFLDDLQITTEATTILNDSFENAWQKTGTWTLTQPTTGPTSGYNTQNAWAVAPFAPYPASTTSTLQLPILDLTGAGNASFTFEQWFRTEYANDSGRVEISGDNGGTWQTLQPATGLLYDHLPDGSWGWTGNSLGWKATTFDLHAWTGSKLYLRFVFHADDASQLDGWYISTPSLIAYPPTPTSQPLYNSYTTNNDAFYAYFENSGTTASFTTPNGQTVAVKYVGSNGDVVARLAANGTLTARQSLVTLGNPTPVANTSFVVTNANWVGQPTSGTWTIHGAPTLLGEGGTQLVVGGKTFDDVNTASEAINGTGNGKISAELQPTLHWNWHNQALARYDTTPTSTPNPEEATNDTRLRYEPDTDADGFSDKAETRGNSDPANATSTPWTDDDQDSVPNNMEPNRATATDPTQTLLNPIAQAILDGIDETHASLQENGAAQNDTASFLDLDNNNLPDYNDITHATDDAQLQIGTDPTTNALSLTTAKAGYQIALLITPDWTNAVLVEAGTSVTTQPATQISYAQLWNELAAYYGATHLDNASSADSFLNTTLRQHLDASMTYTLVKLNTIPGTAAQVGLQFLQGSAADGTWTLVRDTDIPTVQLTVGGVTIDASYPIATLPNLGVLHASWHFLNVWNTEKGLADSASCLSYNVLLREGACSSFPTTQGMRLYSPNATLQMRGLLSQLRVAYYQASLAPQVFDFVQATLDRALPPLSASAAPVKWYGGATQTLASAATNFTISQGMLATADFGDPVPRAFDWSLNYTAPDSHVSLVPQIALGIEPSDRSSQGSSIVIWGATLQALGFDANTQLNVTFDTAHQSAANVSWTDVDGDGVKDYVLTIGHFSKTWVAFAPGASTAYTQHLALSIASTSRMYLTHGYPTQSVYYGCSCGFAQMGDPPSETRTGHFDATSVAQIGLNEAWYAGGNQCDGSNGEGWVLKLSFNPSNPAASTWSYPSYTDTYGQTVRSWWYSGTNCGEMLDIDALDPDHVYVAGYQGLVDWRGMPYIPDAWHWEPNDGPLAHVKAFDSTTIIGFKLNSNLVDHFTWTGNEWAWTNQPSYNLPFTPAPGSMSVQINTNRTAIWATDGAGHAAYCMAPCNSWTSVDLPSNAATRPESIYGVTNDDVWSVGHGLNGGATVWRHGAGAWTNQTSTWDFSSASDLGAVNFQGANEGWMLDWNGNMFHYTGTNTAPSASFTASRTSATTNDTISVDASASSDPDHDPITYTWDWGDGTSGSNGVTATHRYRDASPPGGYTIRLTVTDTQGATNSATRIETITYPVLANGQAFQQSFDDVGEQDYYTFNVPANQDQLNLSLSGPAGTDFNLYTKLGSKPTLSDTNSTSPTSTESIVIPAPTAGTWYIMVRNNAGTGTYTLTASYHTKPTPPTIMQTPNPQFPGQTFWLTGSSNAQSNVVYAISWGDGSANATTGSLASGATYNVSHAYAAVGDVSVSVKATDQYGLSNTNTAMASSRTTPTGATNAGVAGQTSATLSGTLNAMGGYPSADTWFEYGTTTSYGTNTTSVNRTATGTFTLLLTGLATNTLYHYRFVMHDAMGVSNGGDRTFQTLDASPGTPTLTVSSSNSSRGETVWVNGSATDPENDPISYTINWHDGTTQTYPSTGTVPSGSSFSFNHSYASYTNGAPYNISVQTTDALGVKSAYAVVLHDVVDPPAGDASGATAIGRTSVTFNANITSLGGDPSGVLAWFEYGPAGGGFPSKTIPLRYTSTQAVSVWVGSLTEGASYQYRFVVSNERATTTGTTGASFATNNRPAFVVRELVSAPGYTDTPFSFGGVYADKEGEAPPAGYPRVVIDGVAHEMTTTGACTDFVQGVAYAYDTTLASGFHSYVYQWRDSLPDVQQTGGTLSSIEVYQEVGWYAPINQDSNANGLPGEAWARSGPSSGTSGPRWHTIQTPYVSGLADAPDRTRTSGPDPNSISLWFGDDATGTYDNGTSASYGSVFTPPLDLTNLDHPSVTFWTYFDTRDNQNDTKTIYVETSDNVEHKLATLAGGTQGDHKWWPVSLSLADYTGSVRLRFEFDSASGNASRHRGWFLNEITLGTDRDRDNIPDQVEQTTNWLTTWTSIDANPSQVIPPNQAIAAHLYGTQTSFENGLWSALQLYNASCSQRVTLAYGSWSDTIMSGSNCLGRSAGTSLYAEGNAVTIVTNLLADGINPRTMDTPQNMTLTIQNLGSAPIRVNYWKVASSAQTQPDIRDSAGDGMPDGVAANIVGTDPVSRDPDNDGFNNGMDARPYTPDDPPVIEKLSPDAGSAWPRTIVAKVHSRWGIQDVRAWFTGQNGQMELVNPTKIDAETWEWYLPTTMGNVVSIRVGANDTWHNEMEMLVGYSSSQVPQSAKVDFKVFRDASVIAIAVTVSATQTVPSGALALFMATNPEADIVAGAVIGVAAIGIAAYSLHEYVQQPGSVTLITSSVLYPVPPGSTSDVVQTYAFTDYAIAAGTLGCATNLVLTWGTSDALHHRGARGIVDAYANIYGTGASGAYALGNKIRSELLTGNARIFSLTPYTGVMLYADASAGIIDRFQIQVNTVNCAGEIVSEDRIPSLDTALDDELIQFYKAGAALAIMFGIAEYEEGEGHAEPPTRVHLLDAKQDGRDVQEYDAPSIVREEGSWIYRAICTDPITYQPNVACEMTGPRETPYAVELAAKAIEAGQEAFQHTPGFAPAWYWQNASTSARRSDPLVKPTPTVLDNDTATFVLQDATLSAFNDLGSSGSVTRLMPQDQVLKAAELNVRSWATAHPGNFYAMVPTAYARTMPMQVWVEIAGSPSEMASGGGC
jgi:hypothetical protein